MNLHKGTDFDDFLLEEGLAEVVSEAALKQVLIWQLMQCIKKIHIASDDGVQGLERVANQASDANPAHNITSTVGLVPTALDIKFVRAASSW
ncbi:Fis family transcriptional regulator [Pseudomonas sp. 250J]|uniref:Fis family transcriptional regulator n=1 Tax=Pseudomonas peradeniyensis TaxID=2745488 RepID=A0ABT2VGI8_9PSED|nr:MULTISPECIES: hypothetical protein [Pseudomonas]KNX76508.1 Fis family transcriptional regulator [Pseudomonas sp. 250J]MCU7240738.1 Fis family transcriptional regulator [Pseudomonas peradeniyensis]MCU7279324.1 Fis family transcriptional regulator [Pseudomonas peradeniyensis]